MNRLVSIALAASLGVGLGAVGAVVVEPRLPTSPTLRGLSIAGESIEQGTDPYVWLRERNEVFRATEIVLVHGDHRFETTYGEIGASIDVDNSAKAALAFGHSGSLVKRWRQTQQALRGEVDVTLMYDFDPAIARARIEHYASALQRDPVNAELDLAAHRKIRDIPGEELDYGSTLVHLEAQFQGSTELRLLSRDVPADLTINDLENIKIEQVLATFETKFKTWKRGRSKNVLRAASILNGLIIRPLSTVSFNDRVGARSVERGFHRAPEIVGDELTVGIGGGTCQVSSTLYGAALFGGMKIVDRRSHSRPSGYTRLGLDATVAYPRVDLKLMNPFNFTLVVHAFSPEPGVMRVELLGGTAVRDVEYKYGISRIEEYVRRITVKKFLKDGRAFRKQKGTRGMDVFSHVTIHYLNGTSENKQYYSGYRATPEVYWVAPDYEEGELPPLPTHAKGVEGRLDQDGSDVYPSAG
jgi:vancomycin resistance protein YoaR